MNKNFRIVLAIILILLVIYSSWYFFSITKNNSRYYAPNVYTQQWQKAMEWVRENTPENSVFAHWWDYGYWVQSIGKRATVLDGGNAIGYWNHLMGRYALTGTSNSEALSFLYSHKVTHFLIDSTDIGKYGAFSSIGSAIENDRASFIPTIVKESTQTKETKNGIVYLYSAGFTLDEDLIYEQNGTKLFLPSGRAGVGAVLIEFDRNGTVIGQPTGIYIDNGKQYLLPIRYLFQDKLVDYGSGVDSSIFLYPKFINSGNAQSIDPVGAALFLTKRTAHSQLARLYLYQEEDPYFVKVHDEDDFLVSQIKSSGYTKSDFIYYDQFRGPISIWKVNYPLGIQVNQTYLLTDYPDSRLNAPL